jgi:ribonuclease BN (tRNA processing enzyme)
VKVQLLPSSIDNNGVASARQHMTCFIVNDCVSIDAGSLAMACSERQFECVRDVVLTHAHLDHIAGLPLFIDDLFAGLSEPVRVHATDEMIEVLERDIFNWSVYPKFSELSNSYGPVMQYVPYEIGREFQVGDLSIKALAVNHLVPAAGFVVSDGVSKFAITGDTSAMQDFWKVVNYEDGLAALLVECAFPDHLCELADISHHLTPKKLSAELLKFKRLDCPVFVINLKPAYRETIVSEISELGIENLQILEIGRVYEW